MIENQLKTFLNQSRMGVPAKEQVRRYLDWQCAACEPATWGEFHAKHPRFTKETFHSGNLTWRKIHSNDPAAMRWFNDVRLPGVPAKEQVRRYLDWQRVAGEPATWGKFHAKHPRFTNSDYRNGISTWCKIHSGDLAAMLWFNEARSNRSIELVRCFYNQKYAAGASATWKEFHENYPDIGKGAFKSSSASWYKKYSANPMAMQWYKNVRLGIAKIKPTEQARRYLDWRFASNASAAWQEFHEKFPNISEKVFHNDTYNWRDAHRGDLAAIKWFNEIRLNNCVEKVRVFFNSNFATGTSASWQDFHQINPNIKKDVFNNGKRSWRKDNENSPAAIQWFNEVRLSKDRQRVLRYLDWKYAGFTSASWEEFHELYPRASNELFYNGIYTWRDIYAHDPKATIWFNEIRRSPSKIERIVRWLNLQESVKDPAWYWLFHKQYPNINNDNFQNGKKSWKKLHVNDKKALEWLKNFETERVFTSKIGYLFEKCNVSSIYAAMQARKIPMYYNTSNFAVLGRTLGTYNARAKRVEVRLITQDLLGPTSNIGDALRDFLVTNQLPHVAIDFTIGNDYGKKISKYSDGITNLLIVTLSETRNQRQLEPNVRVLGIRDFIGPKWINLDPATRAALERDINQCLNALRGGPDSTSYREFKLNADRKWNEICEEIKILGSQTEYHTRVADDIAKHLQQGNVPKELIAYAETTRAAGHVERANRTEDLAQAVAALTRRAELEQALQELREYPYKHPQSPDNPRLPPDIQADMEFLESLSREVNQKDEAGSKEARDPMREIQADMEYLDALARGDGPKIEGSADARPEEGFDQAVDQEFPTNIDETAEAGEEGSPEDEEREESEDSPENFL